MLYKYDTMIKPPHRYRKSNSIQELLSHFMIKNFSFSEVSDIKSSSDSPNILSKNKNGKPPKLKIPRKLQSMDIP